jgi:uncharacterized membrane protein YgdD (TMEM256/DUF423 family)
MKKTAAFFGATGVILGALGAHALKDVLDPSELNSLKTAVLYQMIHALALLAGAHFNLPRWVNLSWTTGIIFFSFSIYALVLDRLLGLDLSAIGPITPLGGILIVIGWVGVGISKNVSNEV